jgi:hypothetical protein
MKIVVAVLLLASACASSQDKGPSEDLSRLDACLRELVVGEGDRCEYQVFSSDLGSTYAVFIRSADMEALRTAGFLLDSVSGQVATARLTITQLSAISGIPGVIVVENPETATTTGR